MSRKGRNLLLALLGAAHSLNHSIFLVLPLYWSGIANEFEVSLDALGFAATVSTFLYGAGSLVGGSLSDRIGEARIVTIGLMLSGVSTFIFLVAREILGFGVALILMGTWASLYHPTANSLISKIFRAQMAEAMGIHGTGGNIGYMFTPVIAVALGTLWGWRVSISFFGLLSIFVSIILLKALPTGTDKTMVRTRITTSKFWDVIKIQSLWILLVYNIAAGLYTKGVEFIFPTFLQESKGLSKWLAGSAVTTLLATGIFGQWLGGRASDLFGAKRALIATSTGVFLSMLLLVTIPQPIISVSAFILLYGLSFYGHQPARNCLVALMTPDDKRGTIYGVLFFFTFGLGSFSQAIAALCSTRFGVKSAFHAMVLFSVIALFLSLLVPTKTAQSRKRNELVLEKLP